MKGTVSGWKSLSNGGVIESKIWPTWVSSKRTVFSISTPSTEEYLWRVTVHQKFSSAEKDRELEMFTRCWGGMQEMKKGMVLGILGRGAERVQKVAAWYWCCCDFKRMFCSEGLVEMWVCRKTEGEASKNASYPDLLVVLSSHTSFYFSVLASWIHISFNWDVATGFCEVTPIYGRICREGKVLSISRGKIKV